MGWGEDTTAATTICQRLQLLKPDVLAVARRQGASNLRIDGSIAKGQEHNGSDLDLLVDLTADQALLGLIRLQQELEDLLGCPVDVTEAAVPIRNLASIDSQRDPCPGTTAMNDEQGPPPAGEQAFLASRLIQDGVIRKLEVIGEARKKLCSEHRDAYPAIPWRLSGGDVVRP